jgi:4-hydroxy-tetrahydrodipicolinate reductase
MKPIPIMINGLPGNVASMIAHHALGDGRFTLLPHSLTGPEIEKDYCIISTRSFDLVRPADREQAMDAIQKRHAYFISVDFTHPTAVTDNAAFYCRRRLPFVMGTTGGDRAKLDQTIRESQVCAVIAPNMAKQIVGFQAMMAYGAATFPGLFSGYHLTVRESHQAGKADTSGTAKAMVSYFQRMGVDFCVDAIIKERDPTVQRLEWKIPAEYLAGHAWHTYRLTSPDQNVRFEFTHTVNGRDVYAEGTLDAVRFLDRQLHAGATAAVFSMIDVLKGSAQAGSPGLA